MTTRFDRKVYFDAVRASLFSGSMTQQQVDGQNAILDAWENPLVQKRDPDLRWLGYMLATTFHETAQTMQPIEEYGEGAGHPYGVPDAETGQTYYGRGFVQLTWRDNYQRATDELGLAGDDDLVWHAGQALNLVIAAKVMFIGMYQGWFRGSKLSDFFNETDNDAVGARDIINGDVSTIGPKVADYHFAFMDALEAARVTPALRPKPGFGTVHVNIQSDPGVAVSVAVNGEVILHARMGDAAPA